jgi:hypothetical protein
MEPNVSMCLIQNPAPPAPPTNTFGFYLVWNPARGKPKRRHPTLKSAQAEADRLSKKQPNESFYVLQTVTVDRTYIGNITVRNKTHFDHEEKEEIPYARRCH